MNFQNKTQFSGYYKTTQNAHKKRYFFNGNALLYLEYFFAVLNVVLRMLYYKKVQQTKPLFATFLCNLLRFLCGNCAGKHKENVREKQRIYKEYTKKKTHIYGTFMQHFFQQKISSHTFSIPKSGTIMGQKTYSFQLINEGPSES
jgi:uncharacterized membrane-anchored protein YitT (DUF2179 family)